MNTAPNGVGADPLCFDITSKESLSSRMLPVQFEGYMGYAQRAFRAFAERGHAHRAQSREALTTAAQALEQYVARDPSDACAQNLLGLLLEVLCIPDEQATY
jgi:cobalamin biosynthesis protein CobD/CbiB